MEIFTNLFLISPVFATRFKKLVFQMNFELITEMVFSYDLKSWFWTTKNQDISDEPLTWPFARTADSFIFTRSLIHVHSFSWSACGKVMYQYQAVLNHGGRFRTAKNRDVTTGPLACLFACLLAPLIHSRSVVHLFTHSCSLVHSWACWEVMYQYQAVLNRSGRMTSSANRRTGS